MVNLFFKCTRQMFHEILIKVNICVTYIKLHAKENVLQTYYDV